MGFVASSVNVIAGDVMITDGNLLLNTKGKALQGKNISNVVADLISIPTGGSILKIGSSDNASAELHTSAGAWFGHVANGVYNWSVWNGALYLNEDTLPYLENPIQTPENMLILNMALAAGSAALKSFHINSVVDLGVGYWQINFPTKLSVNYFVSGVVEPLAAATRVLTVRAKAAGLMQIMCTDDTNTPQDEICSIIIFDDME